MERFKKTFKGKDGYEFSVSFWLPDNAVKGIVQILHGMVEYIDRYDEFASYLCNSGYAVAGDDHRGHGYTAGEENLGKVPEGHTYFDTIDDAVILTDYLQAEFPNVPTVVFGHSYGSFLAQGYIQQNGGNIDGCILCGSARMDTSDVRMGKKVADMQFKLYGKDKPANLIKKLSFGGYDKPFKHEKRKNAWLNRDVDACEKYNNDKFCNYTMSIGFYKYFFDGLLKIYEQPRIDAINKDLPLFIISGDKDPVGNMGKLVRDLYDLYVDNGIKNVKIKLYNNARHELLNEINKEEVYQDVNDWIKEVIKSKTPETDIKSEETSEKPAIKSKNKTENRDDGAARKKTAAKAEQENSAGNAAAKPTRTKTTAKAEKEGEGNKSASAKTKAAAGAKAGASAEKSAAKAKKAQQKSVTAAKKSDTKSAE